MGSTKAGRVTNICKECGVEYKVKFSHRRRSSYCSKVCQAKNYRKKYLGINNPNYKNADRDYDGYKLIYKDGRQALHKSVALEVLGVKSLPKKYQIHHRDCNINNNLPENLVVLSDSDHRWIHKHFGNTVLWAFMNNKIDLDSLCKWSIDPEKARRLLSINLYDQIGVFKQGELQESLEEDNLQPSLGSTEKYQEGSETNS